MRRVQLLPWLLCLLLAAVAAGQAAAAGRAPAPPPAAPVEWGLSANARSTIALTRDMRTARSAQAAPRLQLTVPIALSTTSASIGDAIYATATVKNVSAAPVSIKYLLAAGRGPNNPTWDCGTKAWELCGADFGAAADLTLQPGQEYAYSDVRVPVARGRYWVEMSYQDAVTQEWQGVGGSNHVEYTVGGGELAVLEPLTLSPPSPRPGQPIVARSKVKNIGDGPLQMRYLMAAGRGPDCAEWSCEEFWLKIADFAPAEDLVLQPGQEYAYVGIAPGRKRGSYFAEMGLYFAKVDYWRFGLAGSNRVTYDTSCDARCGMIVGAYRDLLGKEPDMESLRAAYDSTLDEPQLRTYLCGAADRKAARCIPGITLLQSFLSYLPLNARKSSG
jgi:hypothetical protein